MAKRSKPVGKRRPGKRGRAAIVRGKDASRGRAKSVNATIIDGKGASEEEAQRIGGAVQTAVGGAIMLIGVPMLILPGPGLLAIGGGGVWWPQAA